MMTETKRAENIQRALEQALELNEDSQYHLIQHSYIRNIVLCITSLKRRGLMETFQLKEAAND